MALDFTLALEIHIGYPQSNFMMDKRYERYTDMLGTMTLNQWTGLYLMLWALCLQISEQVCTSYCYWQLLVDQDTVASHWNYLVAVGDTWTLFDSDTWTPVLQDTWQKTKMTLMFLIRNLCSALPSYWGTLSLSWPPWDGPSICCQLGMLSFPLHHYQRGWCSQSWTCYFQVIYNFICLIWGHYIL